MSWNDIIFVRARQNRDPISGLNVHVGSHRGAGFNLLAGFVGGIAMIASLAAPALADGAAKTFSGKCSWYGPGFDGRLAASGEIYSMYDTTAAHKTLPLGSVVRVVDQHTGHTVVVRINDRGPYVGGRIIDLSYASKEKLGMIDLASVYLERINPNALEVNCR